MMQEFTITGGAKIGKDQISWPFVQLQADNDKLVLSTQLAGIYIFHPSEVASIEPDRNGIRIVHTVHEYENDIIFLTSHKPYPLISKIRDTNFLDGLDRSVLSKQEINKIRQTKKGKPFKKSALLFVNLISGGLFATDFIYHFIYGFEKLPMRYGALLAFSLGTLSFFLMLFSPRFQKMVLNKGWELNDVKKSVIFGAAICGLALVNYTFFILL